MLTNQDLLDEITHMRDEIIALQIKVAALESLALNDAQKSEYEKLLKEQADAMLRLRTAQQDDKMPPN